MPEMMAYKSTERRGETFSYLPPMTPDRMRQQISHLIGQGWNPAIEHTEPERPMSVSSASTSTLAAGGRSAGAHG